MAKLRGRAGGAPKPKRKAPKARSGKELQAAKRRPPGGKPGAEAEEEGGASLRFDWILELDREGEALKYGHMVVVERFTVLRGGEEVIGIAAAFQANEAEGAEGNHRQHIRFSVSYDNGKTWTPSICVMYGLQASWSPVLHWDAWTDEDGEKRGVLFLFYSESRKERSPGGDIKCIKAESWEQACGGVDGWKVEDSYWSPPVTILTHEAEICRPSDESARHPIGFPKVLANRVMRTRTGKDTFNLYKDLSGFPLRCTPNAEWVLPFWQEPHNSYLHYEAYHPLKELPPKEGLTPPHRTLAKGSALGPAASVLVSSDYGGSWEVRGAVRHPDTWLIENPVVEVWKSETEMDSSGTCGSLRVLKLWLMFFRTGAGEIWFSQSPPLTPATGGVSGYTWHGTLWCHPPEGSGAYGREWSEPRPVRWARSYPWHPGAREVPSGPPIPNPNSKICAVSMILYECLIPRTRDELPPELRDNYWALKDGTVELLLLAFNDSAESRDRLCVAASANGGEDWTKIMTVRAGPPKNFAYPDILVLNRQEVALSFSENSSGGSGGPASRGLRLATFNVKDACAQAKMGLYFKKS